MKARADATSSTEKPGKNNKKRTRTKPRKPRKKIFAGRKAFIAEGQTTSSRRPDDTIVDARYKKIKRGPWPSTRVSS